MHDYRPYNPVVTALIIIASVLFMLGFSAYCAFERLLRNVASRVWRRLKHPTDLSSR